MTTMNYLDRMSQPICFCIELFNPAKQATPQNDLSYFSLQVMCKLYYFVQAMSYTASITILTVISIERYFAIIYPIRSKQLTTMCLLKVTVVVVWLISAASGVPYLIIYNNVDIPIATGTVSYCISTYTINVALVTTNFVLWYVLPLVLMTIMYTRISIVLWESSRGDHSKKVGGFGGSSNIHGKTSTAQKKTPIKGQQLVAVDSDDTSSAPEAGRRCQGRARTLKEKQDDPGSANEQQKLMDNIDYNSQCESGNPTATSGQEAERDSPDDSLSEDGVDYEDDWPSNRRRTNHIKLNKVNKSRKGSPKCPYKMNGAQKEKANTNGRAIQEKSKSLVKCSSTCGSRHNEKKQDNNALLARRRVIRLLVTVICSFALCVLPYHIRIMWQRWTDPDINTSQLLLPPITFVIYYLNNALNPLLYAFLSERFRTSLLEVLTCKDHRQSRQTQMSFTTKTMNSTVQY